MDNLFPSLLPEINHTMTTTDTRTTTTTDTRTMTTGIHTMTTGIHTMTTDTHTMTTGIHTMMTITDTLMTTTGTHTIEKSSMRQSLVNLKVESLLLPRERRQVEGVLLVKQVI